MMCSASSGGVWPISLMPLEQDHIGYTGLTRHIPLQSAQGTGSVDRVIPPDLISRDAGVHRQTFGSLPAEGEPTKYRDSDGWCCEWSRLRQ